MDVNNLRPEEKAALAKAQAEGVSVVTPDGNTANISDGTPKVTPPANASGDVKPGDKPAADAGNKPQRPEWVPEKFWNAETGTVNTEAMAKSYAELERTRNQAPPKAPEMGQGDAAKAAAEAAARDAAAKPKDQRTPEEQKLAEQHEAAQRQQQEAEAVKARGDAVAAATAEFQRDQKLSDATYQQLAKAGYDRATVDQYIEGQRAQATLILNGIHEQAGGKAAFDAKVAWGSTNYTEAEQNAFNAALRSGDKGQIALAVQGLNARYEKEFGKGADTTVNTNGGAPAGNAFRSAEERSAAMADKRYKSDPAYRAEVAQRIAASQRQGIDIGIRIQG